MAKKAAKKAEPERPKRGRPPLRDVARTSHLTMRISADELENLKDHAEAAGIGVSPFVIIRLEEAGYLAPLRRKAKG